MCVDVVIRSNCQIRSRLDAAHRTWRIPVIGEREFRLAAPIHPDFSPVVAPAETFLAVRPSQFTKERNSVAGIRATGGPAAVRGGASDGVVINLSVRHWRRRQSPHHSYNPSQSRCEPRYDLFGFFGHKTSPLTMGVCKFQPKDGSPVVSETAPCIKALPCKYCCQARAITSSIKKSTARADTGPYGFPSSSIEGECAQFPMQ